MTKTYYSNSCISINVVLPSGKNMHIAFSAKSNGGSTYTTSSADIISAIERHYRFGKLFYAKESYDETKIAPMQEKVTEKTKEQEIRKIKVSDIGTAKDYLADTFGISRTTLRSAKAILEQAALHNIEFDGLE
jgi:hypothetical protein